MRQEWAVSYKSNSAISISMFQSTQGGSKRTTAAQLPVEVLRAPAKALTSIIRMLCSEKQPDWRQQALSTGLQQ